MAFVRTVKTASGATAVQIVHSNRRGVRDIEHLGSAHSDAELAALKAAAAERLAAGQGQLALALDAAAGGPLPIQSSQMSVLWNALAGVYDELGFSTALDDLGFGARPHHRADQQAGLVAGAR